MQEATVYGKKIYFFPAQAIGEDAAQLMEETQDALVSRPIFISKLSMIASLSFLSGTSQHKRNHERDFWLGHKLPLR